MNFIYSNWENFCKSLYEKKKFSITASDIVLGKYKGRFIVLKHDVETNLRKAYRFAKIEHKYGHRGSYYVQAYLLNNEENVHLLRRIHEMGHEVSYHYDVMDSCKGNLDAAITEFDNNVCKFREYGFSVITICQHGNPVIERVGYASNRDFFRNEKVKQQYKEIYDIMVDFKRKANVEYNYFSDAGRTLKLIYDPENNDVQITDDKNVVINNMDILFDYIGKNNCIISVHPHRWEYTAIVYKLKAFVFIAIRTIAKIAMRVPVFKKIMSKYYYLAKII